MTNELTRRLKDDITRTLKLRPERWEGVESSDSLFHEGLALDSLDALELIVMVEREYGIHISDPDEGRQAFESLDTLAAYVQSKQSGNTKS